MSNRDHHLGLDEEETSVQDREEKSLHLDDGRQLAVVSEAGQQTVEIRAASGQLELRVRLTPDGPVLLLEGVKVEMQAAQSVAIKCKEFKVEASESTVIESKGELKISSEGGLELDSTGEVHLRGKTIHLN
jgi:hypothetical protein